MKEQMGSMVKTPMTREEACQILAIELPEDNEPIDHNTVIEVSEISEF